MWSWLMGWGCHNNEAAEWVRSADLLLVMTAEDKRQRRGVKERSCVKSITPPSGDGTNYRLIRRARASVPARPRWATRLKRHLTCVCVSEFWRSHFQQGFSAVFTLHQMTSHWKVGTGRSERDAQTCTKGRKLNKHKVRLRWRHKDRLSEVGSQLEQQLTFSSCWKHWPGWNSLIISWTLQQTKSSSDAPCVWDGIELTITLIPVLIWKFCHWLVVSICLR